MNESSGICHVLAGIVALGFAFGAVAQTEVPNCSSDCTHRGNVKINAPIKINVPPIGCGAGVCVLGRKGIIKFGDVEKYKHELLSMAAGANSKDLSTKANAAWAQGVFAAYHAELERQLRPLARSQLQDLANRPGEIGEAARKRLARMGTSSP
jgi:hypothetical protein